MEPRLTGRASSPSIATSASPLELGNPPLLPVVVVLKEAEWWSVVVAVVVAAADLEVVRE